MKTKEKCSYQLDSRMARMPNQIQLIIFTHLNIDNTFVTSFAGKHCSDASYSKTLRAPLLLLNQPSTCTLIIKYIIHVTAQLYLLHETRPLWGGDETRVCLSIEICDIGSGAVITVMVCGTN